LRWPCPSPRIEEPQENRARLAKLADPRTINLDDAEADKLVARCALYYITERIQFSGNRAPPL